MLLGYLYFSFVIWLDIDKTSEKKRNICGFDKLCVYFYPYILRHIFNVGICSVD